MTLDTLDIITSFERTAEQFFSKEEFRKRLKSSRQQRIKYTIDIKTDDLHIGHAVNLWMIRRLQDAGHKAVIVFNDFASRGGSKDARLETVATYPEKIIQRKIRALTRQLRMILRGESSLLEIHRNSEWYAGMKLQDMMHVFSLVTHARLISRDAFQMRVDEGRELYISEMLYPVLQGYDSYKVMSDIAIVGSDQMFHESMGRMLQEKHKKKPQTLVTTRMTPGIDGRAKQSQRYNNCIALSNTSRDKFGLVMSIPDALIRDYFRVYTVIPVADLAAMDALAAEHPRTAKALLARAIVARYHGDEVAEKESAWFESTVSQGYIPDDIPKLVVGLDRMEALDLVALARPDKSLGDSRRLIAQGGVDLSGYKLKTPDQDLRLKTNDILRVGKKRWFQIEIRKLGSLDTEGLSMRPFAISDLAMILAHISPFELAEALVPEAKGRALKTAAEMQLLKALLLQPHTEKAALFGIFSKDDPGKMIGISHLRWNGSDSVQSLWTMAQYENSPWVHDAMAALGRHAFAELRLDTATIKSAFLFAYAPDELYEAQRRMDTVLLAREDPFGVPGFTRDGWDQMQQWRRKVSPWLYANEPAQSRHSLAIKKSPEKPKPENI